MRNRRLLIVDDSTVIRRAVTAAFSAEPGLEVVGAASSGRIALMKIPLLQPDIILLDISMPDMDGIETLAAIRQIEPRLPVIILNVPTAQGAAATLGALIHGATDFVMKPDGEVPSDAALKVLLDELVAKVGLWCPVGTHRPQLVVATSDAPSLREGGSFAAARVEVLVIGTSTGGPGALMDLIPQLPADFPVPILIVQHMPPVFTKLLADRLDATSRIAVGEAGTSQSISPGRAWVAPGDFHMEVRRDGEIVRIVTNRSAPENSCRPAADVLFRSVATVYGPSVLAVVMTGMGQDGLRGCREIQAAGGQIIVQDEASSVVWGMPGFVARAGLADQVLPLSRLGDEIIARVMRQRRPGTGCRMSAASIMAPGDYGYICDLVRDQSALTLEPGKEYLVESRLNPLARQQGFATFQKMVATLRTSPFGDLHRKVVEAMTNNETSFFRDARVFAMLTKSILPALVAARSAERSLNIWCAACSTGQEPYSVAMAIRACLPSLGGWNIRIIASDMSRDVLARAQAGRYTQFEVSRGLPASFLVKHFEQHGAVWEINEDIRQMVEFRELNLIQPWTCLPGMDLILMRNVLIYVDVKVKKAVLEKAGRLLAPGGYLLLGGSETTMALDDSFEPVTLQGAVCFQRRQK